MVVNPLLGDAQHMNPFRTLRIGQKLTWMIMFTSSLVVLMVCVVFLVYDRLETRDRMVQNVRLLAQVIGSLPGLFSEDRTMAERALAAFHSEDRVLAAVMYEQTGQVFAQYHRDGLVFDPPEPEPTGAFFDAGYLDVIHPMDRDGKRVGTILIRVDLTDLYAREIRYGIFAVVFLIVCSLVSFLVSSRLQVFISGPILRLIDFIKRISKDQGFSVRVHKDTHDEVAELIDVLNEILGEVHQRDMALKEAHDEMENRVSE